MVPPIPTSGFPCRDFLLAAIMNDVKLVGIDLGKHASHLIGQDKAGRMQFCKKMTRKQLIEVFSNFLMSAAVMETFYMCIINVYG